MKAKRTRRAQPGVGKGRRKAASARVLLELYVAGQSPKSVSAIANIKRICKEHLHARCELEVIDLYQQPHRAMHQQIIALPTLIRQLPPPLRRIIGDLSDTERVLLKLGLRTEP
jgi:circadian clock protein KaiB